MANTKKRWTTEEIEILKKHYPTEGDAVFKRLPGRTAKSCRIQASKMKISKNISSAIIQDDRKYIKKDCMKEQKRHVIKEPPN